jgi:hypothetical protein
MHRLSGKLSTRYFASRIKRPLASAEAGIRLLKVICRNPALQPVTIELLDLAQDLQFVGVSPYSEEQGETRAWLGGEKSERINPTRLAGDA